MHDVKGPDGMEATEERFAELVGLYQTPLRRMCCVWLGDAALAEDAVQETLIRFLQTKPVFANDQHEKAWLLRVAANLSKNKLRAEKIRQTDELNEELAAEQRQDLAFVWEAVSKLPERYRQAMHLFYHEGYASREIAQILGRNEVTVRSDLQRGREKLRKILKEEYGLEAEV